MKRFTLTIAALIGCLAFAGCGRSVEPLIVVDNGPLSIEEWRTLNPNIKFDIEVVNRLKEHYPELKTRKGWNAFLKTEMSSAISQSAPKPVSSR